MTAQQNVVPRAVNSLFLKLQVRVQVKEREGGHPLEHPREKSAKTSGLLWRFGLCSDLSGAVGAQGKKDWHNTQGPGTRGGLID